jgi:FkbM family methyltransferase
MRVGARLPRVVRKLPYYARSLTALSRVATLRSIVRCMLTRDKRLELHDLPALQLSAVIDLLVFKETLLDDVYGVGTLGDGEGIVVDVGAGIGDFAITAARLWSLTPVYSFEPNPRAFELLEGNLERHGAALVEAVQLAIGIDGSYVLRGASSGPRASAAGGGADDDTVVVCARRLDEVLPDTTVRLLKIDCEGLELDVLRSATGIIGNVQKVVVEYHRHLLPGADRLVVDFLAAHGFTSSISPDPYDSAIGYVHGFRLNRTLSEADRALL